mmetsp:Transcript_23995/g.66725  ORF Transcript_23995/g.66725 Transcript_23995/m.66725 type:complete len:82 (-) Transcript_23995:5-250(-)
MPALRLLCPWEFLPDLPERISSAAQVLLWSRQLPVQPMSIVTCRIQRARLLYDFEAIAFCSRQLVGYSTSLFTVVEKRRSK